MKRVISWLLGLAHRQFTGSVTVHIARGKVTYVQQRSERELEPSEIPDFDEEFSGDRLVRVKDGKVFEADDVETIRLEYGELPLPLENGDLAEALRM